MDYSTAQRQRQNKTCLLLLQTHLLLTCKRVHKRVWSQIIKAHPQIITWAWWTQMRLLLSSKHIQTRFILRLPLAGIISHLSIESHLLCMHCQQILVCFLQRGHDGQTLYQRDKSWPDICDDSSSAVRCLYQGPPSHQDYNTFSV